MQFGPDGTLHSLAMSRYQYQLRTITSIEQGSTYINGVELRTCKVKILKSRRLLRVANNSKQSDLVVFIVWFSCLNFR